jgi:hypothetical protein
MLRTNLKIKNHTDNAEKTQIMKRKTDFRLKQIYEKFAIIKKVA